MRIDRCFMICLVGSTAAQSGVAVIDLRHGRHFDATASYLVSVDLHDAASTFDTPFEITFLDNCNLAAAQTSTSSHTLYLSLIHI